MKVENLRESLIKRGFQVQDVEEICRLENDYIEECEEIAFGCVEEGNFSRGSNYEIRCENIRKYYDEKLEDVYSKYEETEENIVFEEEVILQSTGNKHLVSVSLPKVRLIE